MGSEPYAHGPMAAGCASLRAGPMAYAHVHAVQLLLKEEKMFRHKK